MASDYLDPVYEMWLAGEIGAGRVKAPGWSDPILRAAWLNHGWIGAPPPDIDPGKVAKARMTNLEMGLTTMDREARNLNGSSASANMAKLRREVQGLPFMPWNQKAPEAAPIGGEAESEEE